VGFTPPFTIRTESRHSVARIAVEGELDLTTAPELSDHLTRAEADGYMGIMLDLRDLRFVDCSGLRTFLAARQRSLANGHRFILVGAGRAVHRLCQLTETEFLLDEQEAVSLLDQFTGSGAGRGVLARVRDRSVHV
jgi:anti-anti-sigma factor